MAARIIDGKEISKKYRAELKKRVDNLKEKGVTPGLAVVLVGDDPASSTYVKNKAITCEELGIYSKQHNLSEKTTEKELVTLIEKLNNDDRIDGILVQLPLPKGLNEEAVINAIDSEKDVDAFSKKNVGAIMIGNYHFLPCTPAGIMKLIESTGVSIEGKNCVVVGRSNIVGKPMAMLLLHANGTVTICHSRTKDLQFYCKNADILVAAVGIAKFITSDMVKAGAIVIDVGMNRDESGKLCGDVDFDGVSEVAGYITPVPGGVGPMTITMLMDNTVTSAQRRLKQL